MSDMRPNYSDYIKSDEWKERRVAALTRAHVRCEFCGREGGRFKNRRSDLDSKDRRYRVEDSNGLEVHHLHYRTLGDEQPADLIVLCTGDAGCHEQAHADPLFREALERRVELRELDPSTRLMRAAVRYVRTGDAIGVITDDGPSPPRHLIQAHAHATAELFNAANIR